VAQLGEQREDLEQQRLLARPPAEVVGHGGDELLLVRAHGVVQRVERPHARVVVGRAAREGGALPREQRAERARRLGRRRRRLVVSGRTDDAAGHERWTDGAAISRRGTHARYSPQLTHVTRARHATRGDRSTNARSKNVTLGPPCDARVSRTIVA
jgi:hypothetical protein